MKTRYLPLVLAATMAVGAAYASNASETSDSPLRAGEMSTMTQGAPNVVTTNSPYGDRTALGGRAAIPRVAGETSDVPLRAGEVTTMTAGAPNLHTNTQADAPLVATTPYTAVMGAGPAPSHTVIITPAQ